MQNNLAYLRFETMKHWLNAFRRIALCSACLLLCGCPERKTSESNPDQPFAGRTLYVFNWRDYMAPELFAEFEQRTGAHVQYDNYSSDAELETKLFTGGSSCGLVFPSDRSVAALIKKDL